MNSGGELISVKGLSKKFGPLTAVDDISFSVRRGEALGLLGPNGAGKSTTMKILTGFLSATSGTTIICGHNVDDSPILAKRCIGYLPEGASLYGDMTAAALLRFVADSRGLGGDYKRQRIDHVIELLRIREVLYQPIETLSKGYNCRVAMAQAILHDPEVLIMDEPTDGLDPNQKRHVRGLIREMAATKAIMISTHSLEEVEVACSRAAIINRGRIIYDGTPKDLMARSKTGRLDDIFRELTVGEGEKPS